MVKGIKKPRQKQNNTINSVLKDKKNEPKSRQQIYQENYQKNKEKKKQQRKERYQQQKQQEQLTTKQQSAKYYGVESIRVLMSFKEYTELNKEKRQLWLDFNWTLKDCREAPSISGIMKLEEVAGNLVRDYWKTAKNEERKGKSWNSISEEQQSKLIKYWGRKKANIENGYIEENERLERQGEEYEKEIELAKFHEERGKIKCECYQCEAKKNIQKQIKQKKILEKAETEQNEVEMIRGECGNCGEIKKVDSDSGICKKCLADDED